MVAEEVVASLQSLLLHHCQVPKDYLDYSYSVVLQAYLALVLALASNWVEHWAGQATAVAVLAQTARVQGKAASMGALFVVEVPG